MSGFGKHENGDELARMTPVSTHVHWTYRHGEPPGHDPQAPATSVRLLSDCPDATARNMFNTREHLQDSTGKQTRENVELEVLTCLVS